MKLRSVAATALALGLAAPLPPPPTNLDYVYPPHPRLILTPSRIVALQAAVAENAQAAFFLNGTDAQATYLLGIRPPPVPGPNATGDARYALQRIYSLSIMWALTRNESWAARATAEALVVAAWPCFDVPCGEAQLNTGEALHALAIALDWLYDYLSPAQRAKIISCGREREGRSPVSPAAATPSPLLFAGPWSTRGWRAWRRHTCSRRPRGRPPL